MTDDLHLARLTPDFTALCGVIGYRIKDTIGWAPWSRLVQKYGWKMLLRAVEQCAPGQRWPQDAERYCIQYAKDEEEAAQPRPAPPPKPTNHAERAALFATIMSKPGLKP